MPATRSSWLPPLAGFGVLVAVLALVEGLIRANLINPFIVPLPSAVLAAVPRVLAEENMAHRFWQTLQEAIWAALLVAGVGIAVGVLLHRFRTLRLATETWVAALAAAPIVLMYPLFLV